MGSNVLTLREFAELAYEVDAQLHWMMCIKMYEAYVLNEQTKPSENYVLGDTVPIEQVYESLYKQALLNY